MKKIIKYVIHTNMGKLYASMIWLLIAGLLGKFVFNESDIMLYIIGIGLIFPIYLTFVSIFYALKNTLYYNKVTGEKKVILKIIDYFKKKFN